MPTDVDRQALRSLLDQEHAQLVEVLPREEYDEEHLPGAVHLPLKQLDARAAGRSTRWDPAGGRLLLGGTVRHAPPSRVATRKDGVRPRVRLRRRQSRLDGGGPPDDPSRRLAASRLDGADREPPTCGPDDGILDLAARAAARTFVVINEQRIVLGRLRVTTAPPDGAVRVGEVMEPGPATVRAHEPLVPLLERMASRNVDEIIVSTPDGELLGVVRRTREEQ